MRTIRHPISGATYDLTDSGDILVTLEGQTGLFTREGVWLEGDVRTADAHLCGWIGGRELPSRHRQAAESFTAMESTNAGGAA